MGNVRSKLGDNVLTNVLTRLDACKRYHGSDRQRELDVDQCV